MQGHHDERWEGYRQVRCGETLQHTVTSVAVSSFAVAVGVGGWICVFSSVAAGLVGCTVGGVVSTTGGSTAIGVDAAGAVAGAATPAASSAAPG
jgi:hypothetical protein